MENEDDWNQKTWCVATMACVLESLWWCRLGGVDVLSGASIASELDWSIDVVLSVGFVSFGVVDFREDGHICGG